MRKTIPWFHRDDYAAIEDRVADLPHRGKTFDEWRQNTAQRVRDLEARGFLVSKVQINPEQFSAWCAAVGQPCSSATLGVFAMKVAQDLPTAKPD